MSQAAKGDKVKVHYTGTLDDGTVFDSSREREPLEFVIGSGTLIPGFENGVLGMKVGETKTIDIPAADAYGERKDGLMASLERSEVPDNIEPKVGMFVEMELKDGNNARARIAKVDEQTIVLDFNHPLAGQDLSFEVELLAVA
ncbi:MAG: peptidylprolyl isomerase [Candidatus Coatesbacteria bacterium]|nr:peptidylprolyl isomerase [Candidatus Coatesbacteria bacterium]